MPRSRYHIFCCLLLLPVLLLAGCGSATTAATPVASPATGEVAGVPVLHGKLVLFAAASLTEAFNQMKTNLQSVSGDLTVEVNYAGSSALRTQLAQGARADVFASADQANMSGAQQDGSIAGSPRVFAQNRLVVIVPAANPAGISGLRDLARPGVKLVLAQPQVPVGNYARQAIDKLSQDPSYGAAYKDQVLANIVSNEVDVKSVLAKVELGEADAGIVYVTDITAEATPKVKRVEIPDQSNVIARYPVGVVKDAPDAANARAFIDYLLSPDGQAILARYGFAPPPSQP